MRLDSGPALLDLRERTEKEERQCSWAGKGQVRDSVTTNLPYTLLGSPERPCVSYSLQKSIPELSSVLWYRCYPRAPAYH